MRSFQEARRLNADGYVAVPSRGMAMGELSRGPPATLTIMLVERLSTWTERVTDMSKGAPSAT